MIGCLRTCVHKQPIIALYVESELVLKFYNLEACLGGFQPCHTKTAYSATKTSYKIEISHEARLDIKLSNKQTINALLSLRGWAQWYVPLFFAKPRDRFSPIQAQLLHQAHARECLIIPKLF